MEVQCSFCSLVGGPCSYDPRDRSRSTEVIPFLNCKRNIAGHKSSLSIADVETEIELILTRTVISFTTELNLSELTICPRHRSSLGIGWRRGSNKCQIPPPISSHDSQPQKVAKAERGLGKDSCHLIWKKLGLFIPVGSGVRMHNFHYLLHIINCKNVRCNTLPFCTFSLFQHKMLVFRCIFSSSDAEKAAN